MQVFEMRQRTASVLCTPTGTMTNVHRSEAHLRLDVQPSGQHDLVPLLLTVAASAANVQNGPFLVVGVVNVVEEVLARVRVHVRRRDGCVEPDASEVWE